MSGQALSVRCMSGQALSVLFVWTGTVCAGLSGVHSLLSVHKWLFVSVSMSVSESVSGVLPMTHCDEAKRTEPAKSATSKARHCDGNSALMMRALYANAQHDAAPVLLVAIRDVTQQERSHAPRRGAWTTASR